ncbi:MAG: sulfatase-like hydrolase/transferase, partial [Verrucomicrobiales bacterium]|nr:sulfatase-like hydrolase/transferase [Verrucomicrobiales bacterium]
AENLLDDTFLFYFGDHGGVLPRGKGYAYETGLHVPLVVRIPENFKHLVTHKNNTRTDGFVSFVDFGPTLLHLAGLDTPAGVDGTPFLGPDISPEKLAARDETFGYADRFDEKYDLVRTLRGGRYTYVRSYQPFNIDALQNDYRYKMIAYREWRDLFHAGKLNDTQSAFFLPRAPEALYDVDNDPFETKNLAADPAHATTLTSMRTRLAEIVTAMPDLSFHPEPVMVADAIRNPVAFGQQQKTDIAQLVAIADLQLVPFAEAQSALTKALNSSAPWQRYWALITCTTHNTNATPLYDLAKKIAATDPAPLVRTRAAEFLAITKQADPQTTIATALAAAKSPTEANLILNTATLLHDAHDIRFELTGADTRFSDRYIDARLAYLSAE